MKKEVKWDIERQLQQEIIQDIEKYWHIRFPDKYIYAVTYHDGAKMKVKNNSGEWKEGVITIPQWRGRYAIVALLSYIGTNDVEKSKTVITYNAFKECLPEPNKIFPFAIDGSGNLFFFDYRKNANEPAIVFLDHERAVTEEDLAEEDLAKKPLKEWLNDNLYPVCDSFSELLDLIEPME